MYLKDEYNMRFEKKIPKSMDELLRDWQTKAKSINAMGANKLTLLASDYFNINRYPTYEDRLLRRIIRKEIDIFLEDKDKLLQEFLLLYNDTQKRLREIFPNQEKITLCRRICKVEYDGYYWNSTMDPRDIIDDIRQGKGHTFSMDILNSWAENPSKVYGIVKLKRDIMLEDIIYFNHKSDFEGPLESDEYIVLNRSPTGEIFFSPDLIEVEDKNYKYKKGEQEYSPFHFANKQVYLSPFNGSKNTDGLLKTLYLTAWYWFRNR